jgi:hypothetical protein
MCACANYFAVTHLVEPKSKRNIRLIWSTLLGIGFPVAIIYPFIDAYLIKHVSATLEVPFDFSNGLLFIASILFGFASLMIVSKEWISKRIWTVLLPPLFLIVLTGVSISNLALGASDPVQVLVFSSAAFNANVVSTVFILGYVTQHLPTKKDA